MIYVTAEYLHAKPDVVKVMYSYLFISAEVI